MEVKKKETVEQLQQKISALQQQLEHASKLSEMGRLLAVVAHEISQPLLGIKAFTQILLRHYEKDEFAAPKLKIIEEQARFMESLLETLREFSRPSEKNSQCSDPAAVSRSVVQLFSDRTRKLHIEVELQAPAQPLLVRLGRGQMQQVVMNLLANAIDAIEPRGSGRIKIVIEPRPGSLHLIVADSGSGVPEEIKDKLFDYFFTTKPPGRGTGLGLAICRQLSEHAGGSIRLMDRSETARVAGKEFITGFEIVLPLFKENTETSSC
jgi:two-component system NtrC family sensor kinase